MMMQVLAFYSIIKYGILRVINTHTVNCRLINPLITIKIFIPMIICIDFNFYRQSSAVRRSLLTTERRSLSNILTKKIGFLLHCYTFGQISWLVDITTAHYRDMICQ
jgi:hypothetical protein